MAAVDRQRPTPIAVHRVGAHVDDVNGYTHCQLIVFPGELRLRLGGPLVRFTSRLYGTTLIYVGPGITVARIRWDFPWQRVALLMPSLKHRALIPLSRKAADVLVGELVEAGFRVSEVEVGRFGAAIGLLEDLSWELIHASRRQG
jgi:hypothetical protein